MTKAPFCDDCGLTAVLLRSSEAIYGRDYGPVWVCPGCEARCGCHKGTHRPLGTLADEETRKLRKLCHHWFDPVWKRGRLGRGAAYGWLASAMNLTTDECHISMFTADQCRRAIELIRTFRGVGRRDGGERYPSVERVGPDYVESDSTEAPF